MRRTAAAYHAPRPLLRRAAWPLFSVIAIFYIGYHALSGAHGLLALFNESRKLTLLQGELAEVSAKRDAIEKKVRGMSNASLDLDLLDEQARTVLGLAGKNEVVYFLDDGGKN